MYQRFIAVGRLGRDPEISTTPGGVKMATLSLATSEYVKGEAHTEWHRVIVWDERLVDVIARRAKKGTLVALEGQVRTRHWEKEGRAVYTTEIVLDRFVSRFKVLANARKDDQSADKEPLLDYADAVEDVDEEIPF